MKTKRAIKHILLIEPDTIQANLISRAIKSSAMQLIVAHDAQAAVAKADKQRPDVVILELALPSHNGIEFLHEFRSYQEWSDVPVVIFSQQYVEDAAMFSSLGQVTYFYKPRTSLAALKLHLAHLFS